MLNLTLNTYAYNYFLIGGRISIYFSTNDILTSSFSSFIQARLSVMAINFRAKVEGLNDKDAGNYEGAVIYDKDYYQTPTNIRKSLLNPSFHLSHSKHLPKIFEGIFCKRLIYQ